MTDKILSISIASYNAEKDISRCLESMINTSVIDLLDIIVVNDGSIDKTFEVASKYAVQFPNSIRVIDKKMEGMVLQSMLVLLRLKVNILKLSILMIGSIKMVLSR